VVNDNDDVVVGRIDDTVLGVDGDVVLCGVDDDVAVHEGVDGDFVAGVDDDIEVEGVDGVFEDGVPNTALIALEDFLLGTTRICFTPAARRVSEGLKVRPECREVGPE